jgi:hypothetical protein
MRGLLASLIRSGGAADDGDALFRPVREFGQGEAIRLGEQAAQSFLQTYGNLLSCFELQGEFALWNTLETFMRTKGLLPEVLEAVEDGDRTAYVRGLVRSQEKAFAELYSKGAIHRLLLVDALPREAMNEWLRMEQSVRALEPQSVAPVAAKAPVAPVVVETPIEACVREFREMPSQAWKTKWLTNMKNRPTADRAFAEGRI